MTSPTDSRSTPTAAQLEAEIAATREQLAETVSALSDKLDVNARVHEQAHRAKQEALHTARVAKDRAVSPAGGLLLVAVVGVAALILWRKQR